MAWIGRGLLLLAALASPADYRSIATVAGTGRKELGPAEGKSGSVNIGQPFGVEMGPGRVLYICEVENHRVHRLDPATDEVRVVAGNGKKGGAGDGGPATEASLDEPYEVRRDRSGDLFIVEMVGARVRRVDARTGIINTIAGTGKPGFRGDGGPATAAQLDQPHSIALDGKGSLYIADIGNHRIRRVDLATGLIETIAGNGSPAVPEEGSIATGKPLRGPRALCVTDDTLWIALREGNAVWKLDLLTRRLSRVAGTGEAGFLDGPARETRFNGPKGIAAGPRGDLFVADTENQAIRRIDVETGMVSTVAGVGPSGRGYGGDGGPPRAARFDRPHGITIGPDGAIYVGDTNNHRVRKVVR